MKINLANLGPLGCWLDNFVFNLMTHHTPNADDWKKVFHLTGGTYKDNPNECDITVSVNGVELDFGHFLKRLEEEHEKFMEEKAKELINNSFGNLISVLDRMSEDAKCKLSDDVLPSWAKNKKE